MQTILGASGQIGHALAIQLRHDFTDDIRLVGRNPKKVNDSDQFRRADLLDAADTLRRSKAPTSSTCPQGTSQQRQATAL